MRVVSSVFALLSGTHAARIAVDVNETNQWIFGEEAEAKVFTGKESSPFGTYIAESKSLEPGCPARAFRSTCGASEFNGVVVYMHGFSGCSDQADKLGARLSKNCYDVLAPTLPGHGTPLNTCSTSKCTVQIGRGKGFDLTNLPTHENGYLEFTQKLAVILRDETAWSAAKRGVGMDKVPVSVVGFALGAPVALKLVMQNPVLFGRMMLLNPYFAMGDEDVDRKAVQCEYNAKKGKGGVALEDCRQNAILDSLTPLGVTKSNLGDGSNMYFNWLASSRGTFEKRLLCNLAKASNTFGSRAEDDGAGAGMLNDLMEGERTWNTVCDQTLNHGRKGFCKFKTKHVLALHAFATRAMVDAQAWGAWSKGVPVTQVISSQRDGRTRNGMSFKISQHLKSHSGAQVSFCMHRFQQGVNPTNPQNYWNDQLVMPHAIMMPQNAYGWWETGLYSKIAQFVSGKHDVSGPSKWDGKRETCQALPLDAAGYSASKETKTLVVPEAASTSKVNCVWVGPLWSTVSAYDQLPTEYKSR